MNRHCMIIGAPISPFGGTVRRLRLWFSHVPEGNEVVFLYFSQDSDETLFPRAGEFTRVSLVRSPAMGRWGRVFVFPAVMAIGRKIVQHRPSVVVSFFPWAMFAAGIATRAARRGGFKIRHVVHLAGDPVHPSAGFWGQWIYKALFRMTLRVCDEIVVLSESMANTLQCDYVLPHRLRVRVVPIAIDKVESKFDYDFKNEQRSELVFGIVSRLYPVKACDIGLYAFATVARQSSARLVIYGTGPEETRLRKLARELGISEYVEFRGWINDPLEAYRHMDCALLPSISEGTPRAFLEAASVGVPMIASAVGGVPDLIEHGRTGWLVPAGNVQALTDVMLDVARRPVLLDEVGAKAKAFLETRLSPSEEVRAIFGES